MLVAERPVKDARGKAWGRLKAGDLVVYERHCTHDGYEGCIHVVDRLCHVLRYCTGRMLGCYPASAFAKVGRL